VARKRFGRAIGARSARKLLREIGGAPDPALAAEWERVLAALGRPDEEIYRLNDGRVLWVSYGSANIFGSADDYRALLALVEQDSLRTASHPLGQQFPSGQGFIEAVPRLVAELPARLHLSAKGLTGTVESLELIDKAARRIGGQTCLEDPTILAPIVAYVGEVMRSATNGRWEIREWEATDLDESGRWQPVIVGANGRTLYVFGIFKELLEEWSICGRVAYDVSERRL
jgi:hypothetical protein